VFHCRAKRKNQDAFLLFLTHGNIGKARGHHKKDFCAVSIGKLTFKTSLDLEQ
jgi:hypothetical protein